MTLLLINIKIINSDANNKVYMIINENIDCLVNKMLLFLYIIFLISSISQRIRCY